MRWIRSTLALATALVALAACGGGGGGGDAPTPPSEPPLAAKGFYASGSSGAIWHSADGMAWSELTPDTMREISTRVTAGNGLFVVGGGDDAVLGSASLLAPAWQSTPMTPFHCRDVAFGVGAFVAVGETTDSSNVGKVLYGDAPSVFVPATIAAAKLNAVAFGAGTFVVGGQFTPGLGEIWTSGDGGASWQRAFLTGLSAVVATRRAQGVFMAIGRERTGAVAFRSTDGGASWQLPARLISSWGLPEALAFGDGVWVAVGGRLVPGGALLKLEGTVWRSTNAGFTWDRMPWAGEPLKDVTFGGGHFVAVGVRGAIVTSADGTTWTTAAVPNATENLVGVSHFP